MVDECALPHPTIAAEQRDFIFQQRHELVDTLPGGCRNLVAGIADGVVELANRLLIVPLVGREPVRLVEHQHHRNPVGFGRRQKAIDEDGACLRIIHRDDEHRLVDVGGQNVALFAQVLRLTNDIVSALINARDERRPFLIHGNLHMVAHSNRVGAANAFQAKIAFDFAFHQLAIIGFHRVPAARIFND